MQIFDASSPKEELSLSPEEIKELTPGNMPEFHNRAFYLQRMWLNNDWTMWHFEMWDASYDFNRRKKSTDTMTDYMIDKSLVIVKSSRFEIVCHGKIINPCAQQVVNILNWDHKRLVDPFLPGIYEDHIMLDNNYFFSTREWHSEKFLKYLLWEF